ncbi:hypothetical protein OESDEN_02998 [Oesophagostomum dentatum]|uniref:Uncharacterized protein n=1 Tax=Oesophagostomum dentatum TaxID=61180 RepID=A0A0B1TMH7_OESDE|nr:hypothetical protein OESDEN_02998 [Oesophagostomum dentatum]
MTTKHKRKGHKHRAHRISSGASNRKVATAKPPGSGSSKSSLSAMSSKSGPCKTFATNVNVNVVETKRKPKTQEEAALGVTTKVLE